MFFQHHDRNIVTNGLMLNLVASRAKLGLDPNTNGDTGNRATWTDISGRGHNGALSGFAWTTSSGWDTSPDHCLDFADGNQIITVTGHSDFSGSAWTAEFWMLGDFSNDNDQATVIISGNGFSMSYNSWNSDQLIIWLSQVIYTGVDISGSNQWHLVVTYDDPDWKVYVNNGSPTTGTDSGGSTNTSNIVFNGSDNNRFGGNLYAWRWYNRALTAAEVSQNYNAGRMAY